MAERELAAFLNAVTELYGTEEAEMAAEIWLDELQGMNNLPGPAIRDWRKVTVSALSRLASRLSAMGNHWPSPVNDFYSSTLIA